MPKAGLAALLVVLLGSAATRAGAQGGPRPRLSAQADTNSWEAYFDKGVQDLKMKRSGSAAAAFYWASQLAPQRAEPVAGAPWYAAPHYSLAVALEDAGQPDSARVAFERYVALARREDSSYVAVARRELARLAGQGGGQ